jgi:hypothetical protein
MAFFDQSGPSYLSPLPSGVLSPSLGEAVDLQQMATDLGPITAEATSQKDGLATPVSWYDPSVDYGAGLPTPIASARTSGATSSISSKVASFFSGGSGFTLPSLEDSIFILLGLLLIAAGVFAFKTSQTIIQTAGKLSTHVAEATA